MSDFDSSPVCCKCLSVELKWAYQCNSTLNAEWFDLRCLRCGHLWEMKVADAAQSQDAPNEENYII
jgi:hypothetical protein